MLDVVFANLIARGGGRPMSIYRRANIVLVHLFVNSPLVWIVLIQSKKVHQRVRRFFGFLFQNPVAGVRQYDHGDIVRDEFHLRAKFVT